MNISIEHVTQKYGSHEVLHDVSFESKSGEVLALLGPNGSGKSTLIKTMQISSLLLPEQSKLMVPTCRKSTLLPGRR